MLNWPHAQMVTCSNGHMLNVQMLKSMEMHQQHQSAQTVQCRTTHVCGVRTKEAKNFRACLSICSSAAGSDTAWSAFSRNTTFVVGPAALAMRLPSSRTAFFSDDTLFESFWAVLVPVVKDLLFCFSFSFSWSSPSSTCLLAHGTYSSHRLKMNRVLLWPARVRCPIRR